MNLQEKLEAKFTQNKFTQNDFRKIIQNIKQEIIVNKEIINQIQKIDRENSKNKKISIENLIKIIQKYEEYETIKKENSKNILISYYGDPYITMEICIKSIISNNKVIIAIEDYMLGINKVIVNICNKVLKEKKLNNSIYIINLLSEKEIKHNIDKINKIFCIGNKNTYRILEKNNIQKVEFIPFNNINLYCDSEKMEDLKEKICEYAYENYIEIEDFENQEKDSIERVIDKINRYGEGDCTLILTENKDKEKIINKIKTKYVYINENPFNKNEFEMQLEKII